jgi:TonB family protein
MNAYLNYLIEANLGLCFFLAFYFLLFVKETDFRIKRGFILAGIVTSLLFPLLHLNNAGDLIPSLNTVIPAYWLPEVVIGGESSTAPAVVVNGWYYAGFIYAAGVVMFLMIFIIQLVRLARLIRHATVYRQGKFVIAESAEEKSIFSFFHFIFIGQKDSLSAQERLQIIRHECVHGQQFHSCDILLLSIVKIFFWFNPLLHLYKKILVQLHEFEADARAVEDREVNDYCNLLAKVALQSAGFKLANHFNHSLTLKRIMMMRTNRTKTHFWKIALACGLLPAFFFLVACQDQIAEDLTDIASNSSATSFAPPNVQARLEELQREHPESKYILLQLSGIALSRIKELEDKYGHLASMEIFTAEDHARLEAEKIIINPSEKPGVAFSFEAEKVSVSRSGGLAVEAPSFGILEYTEGLHKLITSAPTEQIYTVVEEMPAYKGGLEAMSSFLGSNIQYPESARKNGTEGTVFTQFIVNTDGSMSDITVMQGIGAGCDEEAVRVLKTMPPWTPGMQNGKAVRVRFVLPIKFKL